MKIRILNVFAPLKDNPWEGISWGVSSGSGLPEDREEEALEAIRRGFFPKQAYHYGVVRDLVLGPMFKKAGERWIPNISTSTQIEQARRWLDSDDVGSGRSTLLAVCYLEAALLLPNWCITCHDHKGGGSRKGDAVYRAIQRFWDEHEVFQDRVSLAQRGHITASEKGRRDLYKKGTL